MRGRTSSTASGGSTGRDRQLIGGHANVGRAVPSTPATTEVIRHYRSVGDAWNTLSHPEAATSIEVEDYPSHEMVVHSGTYSNLTGRDAVFVQGVDILLYSVPSRI
ncbi:hypothetical protein D8S78_04180 [Natrialba swarupiae]|nr:hypothetical protein [Natrialba swarupiae]